MKISVLVWLMTALPVGNKQACLFCPEIPQKTKKLASTPQYMCCPWPLCVALCQCERCRWTDHVWHSYQSRPSGNAIGILDLRGIAEPSRAWKEDIMPTTIWLCCDLSSARQLLWPFNITMSSTVTLASACSISCHHTSSANACRRLLSDCIMLERVTKISQTVNNCLAMLMAYRTDSGFDSSNII